MPAHKTFQEFAEGWIFCGFRLLLYRIERCAAIAHTPEELALVSRMKEALYREAAKEDIVPQKNEGDRYTGAVIEGRWQVMESFYPRDTYVVVDLFREDLLIREHGPASNVRRFPSIADAEAYISQFTSTDSPAIPESVADAKEKETTMARNAKANDAAVKAAEKADKAIGGRKAAGGAKAAQTASKPAEKPAPAKKAAASGVKDVSGRGRTMAAAFRELIAKPGKMTDEQIHQKVEAEFGKKIPSNAVEHYRADLERRRAAGQQI